MHWFFSYTTQTPDPCSYTRKTLWDIMDLAYGWQLVDDRPVAPGARHTMFVDNRMATGQLYPPRIIRNLHGCDAGIIFLSPIEFTAKKRLAAPTNGRRRRGGRGPIATEHDVQRRSDFERAWERHHWLFKEAEALVDRYLAGHARACVPIFVGTTEEEHPVARRAFRYAQGLLYQSIDPGETRMDMYRTVIEALEGTDEPPVHDARAGPTPDHSLQDLIDNFLARITGNNGRYIKTQAVYVLLRPSIPSCAQPNDGCRQSVAKYISNFGPRRGDGPPALERVDEGALNHAVAYLLSGGAQRFYRDDEKVQNDYIFALSSLRDQFVKSLPEVVEKHKQIACCQTQWVTTCQKAALVQGMKRNICHFLLIHDPITGPDGKKIPDDKKIKTLREALIDLNEAAQDFVSSNRFETSGFGYGPHRVETVLGFRSSGAKTHRCLIDASWHDARSSDPMEDIEKKLEAAVAEARKRRYPVVIVDYRGILLEKGEVADVSNLIRFGTALQRAGGMREGEKVFTFTFATKDDVRKHSDGTDDFILIELDLAWRHRVREAILMDQSETDGEAVASKDLH